MVAPRKPTVLTPKVPRASRAKPKAEAEVREWHPRPGWAYRVRICEESPFGGFERPFYTDDLFDAEIRQAEHEAAGIRSVLEHANRNGYGPPPRHVVTVAELAEEHLARQWPDGKWTISPEGQRRIYESMGL